MDFLNEALLRLKRLEGEIERLKTIEQPVTAIGGWLEIPDGSWSYASATTITVPSGAASIYAVGDQIRLKQGGAYKYFYIITVADTLLTVTSGSDYSVANVPITNAAFSKGGGVGHPGWFNWTPTIGYVGGTTDPTSETITSARFCLIGKTIKVAGRIDIVRGSGDRTTVLVSYPIPYSNPNFSGSAHSSVVATGYQAGFVRLAGNIVIELNGAMARDGVVVFSVDYT